MLTAVLSRRNVAALLLVIVLLAFGLRFTDITLRPFHNDEGVNFFFIQGISQKGYYEYSHLNYHGPAYFYLTKFFTNLIGENEMGMRFSAILVGTLTVLVLLPLIELGQVGLVIISAILLALSPSLVFFSRYAIHETLFLFSSALLGVSLFLWIETRKKLYTILAGIALGLLISTKETFIISLFGIFWGLIFLGRYNQVLCLIKEQWKYILYATLLTIILIILFFTGGLKWINGIHEMFLAVPQWVGRNKSDTGHFKPFKYYAEVIWKTEPYLIMVFIGSFVYSLVEWKSFIYKPEYRLGRFLLGWTFSIFLVYSFLDYKTIWLIINLTFPAILLTSFWLKRMLLSTKPFGVVVLLAVLGITIFNLWRYNFEIPYGNSNPYSYVHSTPGMLEVVKDIDAYWNKNPNARVLIGVDGYWPLPFYLRSRPRQLGYQQTSNPENYKNEYQIIIAEKDSTWAPADWSRKYYRLSEVEETYTYFKRIE